MRTKINENVDYLYGLQKDETVHQDHRLMWILTAQALIFTGLCSFLSKGSSCIKEPCVIILVLLVGVLISISGLYSMLISKTAIGTVYERWNKYASFAKKKQRLPLHHIVSLAPNHFLKSKISWLMFCHFAPNAFCAAWITLLLAFLMDKVEMLKFMNDKWYSYIVLFIILLITIVSISDFLGKHYLFHWGYDQYHESDDEAIPSQCDNCIGCDLTPNIRNIYRSVGCCENCVIQNSLNNYNCGCQDCSCKSNNQCSDSITKANASGNIHQWSNLRIYHIVIDRFNGILNQQKDEKGFYGGTLKGIIEKIDYISSMGYNAIMLTPIFQSNAYHGYHITDFETIDEHFGDWNDFDELIDTLHQKGMKLLCDYVPNHCHISHPFFQSALNDSNSPYRDWFYFDASRKGGFVSYQNFEDLPKFNLYNDAAADYLISIAIMLAKRNVDGNASTMLLVYLLIFW